MAETLHLLTTAAAIIGGAILVFCTACCLYLFVIILAGFCAKRRRKNGYANRELTFALLIPAHDEELLIGKTVASAKQIDYPADKFKVFVVADNCTDSTAARASEAGANVFERTDSHNRGKGHALVAGLKHIFESMPAVDAVAIVDADTQIDPAFLSAMSDSIAAGECAIQGVYLGSNQHDSWR